MLPAPTCSRIRYLPSSVRPIRPLPPPRWRVPHCGQNWNGSAAVKPQLAQTDIDASRRWTILARCAWTLAGAEDHARCSGSANIPSAATAPSAGRRHAGGVAAARLHRLAPHRLGELAPEVAFDERVPDVDQWRAHDRDQELVAVRGQRHR